MPGESRRAHWEAVYSSKSESEVSWFQKSPTLSLELIDKIVATRFASVAGFSIIDIGGGTSRLVDHLVDRLEDVTVLDLSDAALQAARNRLGKRSDRVRWIAADATIWQPEQTYDIWHDRAAFHFLTEQADRAAYIERLQRGVNAGGHAIFATFAPDGPEKCSGLPVMRYDPESLAQTLGSSFELVDARRQVHATPWKSDQSFQFSVFRRRP